MGKKILFMDRDGVLNRSAEWPKSVLRKEDFEFLPQTFETLRCLRDAGYEFYVITNQAGIGRGEATLNQVEELHLWMVQELLHEGIEIKGVYMCPHRQEENCDCRKPKPGLLLQAVAEHHLDPAAVVFVGDRSTDEEAGKAAGIRTILIPSEVGICKVLDVLL